MNINEADLEDEFSCFIPKQTVMAIKVSELYKMDSCPNGCEGPFFLDEIYNKGSFELSKNGAKFRHNLDPMCDFSLSPSSYIVYYISGTLTFLNEEQIMCIPQGDIKYITCDCDRGDIK